MLRPANKARLRGGLTPSPRVSYTPGGRSDEGKVSRHRELKWEIQDKLGILERLNSHKYF